MPTSKRRPAKRATRPRPSVPSGDEPIVLSGPPRHLVGQVTVENATDDARAIHAPVLHLTERDPVEGSGAAIIPPGETTSMGVTFHLDEATPPGTYDAELEVDGQRQPARVAVLPEVSLWVEPSQLLAEPGRQEVTLLVTNDGNVRMPLSSLTLAPAVSGGRAPEPGTEAKVPTVALVLDEPVVVEPGQSLTVSGHLDVPDDLDPARRHIATVPVGVADVDVIVLPRSSEPRSNRPRSASEKKS